MVSSSLSIKSLIFTILLCTCVVQGAPMFRKFTRSRSAIEPIVEEQPQDQPQSPTPSSSPEHLHPSVKNDFARWSMHHGGESSHQHHSAIPGYHAALSQSRIRSRTQSNHPTAENDETDDYWHEHALKNTTSSSPHAPPSHHNGWSQSSLQHTNEARLKETERLAAEEIKALRERQRQLRQSIWHGLHK
jgi:hypothetical protein